MQEEEDTTSQHWRLARKTALRSPVEVVVPSTQLWDESWNAISSIRHKGQIHTGAVEVSRSFSFIREIEASSEPGLI